MSSFHKQMELYLLFITFHTVFYLRDLPGCLISDIHIRLSL